MKQLTISRRTFVGATASLSALSWTSLIQGESPASRIRVGVIMKISRNKFVTDPVDLTTDVFDRVIAKKWEANDWKCESLIRAAKRANANWLSPTIHDKTPTAKI